MKIAIVGSNGFVGRSLGSFLSNDYNVYPITSQSINLLDSKQTQDFLQKHKFDVIINAAARMSDPASINDTYNNLGLFMNLYNNRNWFGKMINLASGAEFDRSIDINNVTEEEIFNRMPNDSYGFGQNVKSRLCYDTKNFYTLRIFNCFGSGELSSRLFPKFLSCTDTFTITNDRYFDFFSIQDLCTVVEHFATASSIPYKDINCVYQNKLLISETILKFAEIKNITTPIEITSSIDKNYTGSGQKLAKLNIKLDGLENGFKNYND
jgi:nucleoside-diphosphate-sugar epimerase